MKFLNAYSKFLDVLTKIIKVLLVITLSAMVLIMFYQVIMRYIFSNAQPWCEELTLYLGAFMIMLSLGIASRKDSHLQVDFITRLYSPKFKCLMTAIFSLAAIVIMGLFCKYSISLIATARASSPTMPFITMKMVYSVFPIGCVVLLLYTVEIIVKNIVGFLNNGELPVVQGKN